MIDLIQGPLRSTPISPFDSTDFQVEIGRGHFNLNSYGDLLDRWLQYVKALSKQRSTCITKTTDSLICGRMIGNQGQDGSGVYRRLNYCRSPTICHPCNGLKNQRRASIIAGRQPPTEKRVFYSFVFTTPQPVNVQDELSLALLTLDGMSGIISAIGKYNRRHGEDGERVHDYAVGLHLQPSKSNATLLWSHLHLMAVVGRNAFVGTGDTGLAAKLFETFDLALRMPTKPLVTRKGTVGDKVLTKTQQRDQHRPSGVPVNQLERSFAYVAQMNRHDDTTELVAAKAKLISQLGNRRTSSTSRASRNSDIIKHRINLPHWFPPMNDGSTTVIIPFDNEPIIIDNRDGPQALSVLTSEARDLAKRWQANNSNREVINGQAN